MSNSVSNFPQAQATRSLDGTSFVSESVSCIMELGKAGKPQNIDELKERIALYFRFCEERAYRPGIESLSLALGTNRVQFWRWCGEDAKDTEWRDVCQKARQAIVAFTEAALTSGHLSPPIGIFLMKNIADYRDAVSFEDITPSNSTDADRKHIQYPVLSELIKDKNTEDNNI